VRRIRLLVPGNIRHSSGGNVYNARLVEGLKALGADVEVLAVEGTWPDASAHERRRLGSLLGAWEPGGRPGPVIVDGLIAVGAPDELEFAAKAGRQTWILVHMPLPDTSLPASRGSEARALRAASGVICTSTTAATTLAARGLEGVHVALPGTDDAPPAAGASPPHFVAVAALLPNKDQLLLLDALAGIRDLQWTAALVGSDSADPVYADAVRGAVTRLGLADRVSVRGELRGQALEAEWNRAGLSLLISRTEAYGMVVTESLARAIPVVVRAGTGAVEALAAGSPLRSGVHDDGGPAALPGAAVVLDTDPAPLEAVLRTWLTDPGIRSNWRGAALAARSRLPGWETTARTVLDAIAAAS
jgi:glycosyltransferase involved in cell wall biosynthesis